MSNPRRILGALCALCLSLSILSCGARPQPAANAAVEARLQRTLEGHTEGVTSVAYSPDSRWLASSGYDNTIKLYALETHGP